MNPSKFQKVMNYALFYFIFIEFYTIAAVRECLVKHLCIKGLNGQIINKIYTKLLKIKCITSSFLNRIEFHIYTNAYNKCIV